MPDFSNPSIQKLIEMKHWKEQKVPQISWGTLELEFF